MNSFSGKQRLATAVADGARSVAAADLDGSCPLVSFDHKISWSEDMEDFLGVAARHHDPGQW